MKIRFQQKRLILGCLFALFSLLLIFAAASEASPLRQVQVDINNKEKAPWDVAPIRDLKPAQIVQMSQLDADECFGPTEPTVWFADDNVITIDGCHTTWTLTDLAAHPLITPDFLELVDPVNKIWMLREKLHITEGVTFNFFGGEDGDVNWLRLHSDDESGIYLRGTNSTLRFVDTKVTSWNEATGAVDEAWDKSGRSYIAVRTNLYPGRATNPATDCDDNGGSQEIHEARMDVINSEMSYLGYYAGEAYGVSWKVFAHDRFMTGRSLYDLVDVFGEVRNSKFDNDFFGGYTYGGYCMEFTDNLYENNMQYGLDPHDDSDHLLIDNNVFRNNGTHGFICSVYCNNLVITNNESYGNGLHGIMLHRHTNDTLVENNVSYDNGGMGIIIFDSHDNIVRNNEVRNNGGAGLAVTVGASNNVFEDNLVEGHRDITTGKGYVVQGFMGTDEPYEGDGRPKNNIFRNNEIIAYKSPLVRMKESSDNIFEDNNFTLISDDEPLNVFDFSPGYGNIVKAQQFSADTEIGNYIRTAIRTDIETLPEAWTIVEDLDLNETFNIVHHSAGTTYTQFRDSRNYIFKSGDKQLPTMVTTSDSSLDMRFDVVGGNEPLTVLNFIVVPENGTVSITPKAWSAESYEWVEDSEDGAENVMHTLGSLTAGDCYEVRANGNEFTAIEANDSAEISFIYEGGYQKSQRFTVTPVDNDSCNPAEKVAVVSAENDSSEPAQFEVATLGEEESEQLLVLPTASALGVGTVERPEAADIILLAALATISFVAIIVLSGLYILRSRTTKA